MAVSFFPLMYMHAYTQQDLGLSHSMALAQQPSRRPYNEGDDDADPHVHTTYQAHTIIYVVFFISS